MTEASLPEIVFAPNTNFSPEEKERILNWGPFKRALEQRQKTFRTYNVVIRGIAATPAGKLIRVYAGVNYKNPSGTAPGAKDPSYSVSIGSDAASLTVIFRVAGKKATQRQASNYTGPEYHVLVIREPRWGPNDPHSLQVPAGLLEAGEELTLKKIKEGAAREFFEEVLPNAAPELVEFFGKSKNYKRVCDPITLSPEMNEKQTTLGITVDCTRAQFARLRRQLVGLKGGKADEGEDTVVDIVPLWKMPGKLKRSGSAPWTSHILASYIDDHRLYDYMAAKKPPRPSRTPPVKQGYTAAA